MARRKVTTVLTNNVLLQLARNPRVQKEFGFFLPLAKQAKTCCGKRAPQTKDTYDAVRNQVAQLGADRQQLLKQILVADEVVVIGANGTVRF